MCSSRGLTADLGDMVPGEWMWQGTRLCDDWRGPHSPFLAVSYQEERYLYALLTSIFEEGLILDAEKY